MKSYLISSTEYEANVPDRFIMDENGNYYGVMPHSYAKFHEFPKNIDFWMNAHCSDEDRFFTIKSVDIDENQLEKFDSLTREYIELEENSIEFGEHYPEGKRFGTKREFENAVNDFLRRYSEWMEENRKVLTDYMNKRNELSKSRVEMFKSFMEEKKNC